MKGMRFIGKYLFRDKILVIVSLIFVIFSTYLQVESPKEMGNSITYLSNYAIVKQVQGSKATLKQGLEKQMHRTLTDAQFNDIIKNMTDEQVNAAASKRDVSSGTVGLKAQNVNSKTGFTIKELLLAKPITYEDQFYNSISKFLLLVLLIFISTYTFNFSMTIIGSRSGHFMRFDLFKKLQKLAISYFDKKSDGDVLSIFTNDIDNIGNLITQALVQIVSSVFLLVAITYAMLTANMNLGLIVVVLGVILIVSLLGIMKKASKYISLQQNSLGELDGFIDEKIGAQKVIITNGLEEDTVKKFKPFNNKFRKISIKGQTYSSLLTPIIMGFNLICVAGIILFGSRLALENVIEIGMLITFIQYSQNFFRPFNQISAQYSVIQLGITGALRVAEIYDVENDVASTNHGDKKFSIEKKLELKDVNFSYIPGRKVLKNINLEINKGQMVALVGPTGSGKTTIMNLLNRFYDIDSGSILFDGIDIKDIDIKELRRNIGIVLQESVLFEGTVKDNIAFGKVDATDEEVKNAAIMANVNQVIEGLENGYETEVGEGGGSLSTGQKQLLSMARTILTDPELLILDEATSNVDTVTEAKIQRAMNEIVKNRTSFVIAHRLKTILNADVILVLNDGELVQKGSHKELYNEREGLYRSYYDSQFIKNDK